MMFTSKEKAKENYISAKKAYSENQTKENWIAFCDAKRACMMLGIKI